MSPVTATMAKHAELHLLIHTLDMLLSISAPRNFVVITNFIVSLPQPIFQLI